MNDGRPITTLPRTHTGFKELLLHIYTVYNPHKIEEVEKIIARFVGRREELIRGLGEKYDFPVSLPLIKAPLVDINALPLLGSVGFRQLLRNIYEM